MQSSLSALKLLLLLGFLSIGIRSVLAQQSTDPHLGYIFPAGGQRGTSLEAVVGGQFLDGTTEALVSGGSGVVATVLRVNKPFPAKRYQELQNYIEEARKKPLADAAKPSTQTNPQALPKQVPVPYRFLKPEQMALILKESGASDDEIKAFFETRKQRNDPKRQNNQQISESVTLKIEIAADAPKGPREIRLLRPNRVSNPIHFCVGELPELVCRSSEDKTLVQTETNTCTLPVVVNGQILPGGDDRFSFHATRGTHLVISAQGRDLIPYLADAVPGWFQPALALYDEKGGEAAFGDHFYFNTDPVLYYEVPEDGNYCLEIRDRLSRGREDFVYRITIGEVPFVSSIFPLGGRLGTTNTLSVSGWNLPTNKITFTTPNSVGTYPVQELSNGFITRNTLFAADSLPDCMEVEPNDTPKHAQHVKLPIIINGRINPAGDVDVFSIHCHAGERIVAEITARRLNSPLDSWLRVTDATGRQLAFNDDHEDKGAGLLTQCADSYVTFTAPTKGNYYIHVGDAQGKGGPEYGYRLRISEPMPDFALYLTPSSINGRAGISVPVTLHAVRKDGFSGEISLVFKDDAAGFLLDGAKIPEGAEKTRMTVSFPKSTEGKPVSLSMEGQATLTGGRIVHPVTPAEDMIQAFMNHHLVPANEFVAMAAASKTSKQPVRVVSPGLMKLQAGGSAQVVLSMAGGAPVVPSETKLQLSEAPDGISIGDVSATTNGLAVTFKADASKVKSGLKGNLLIEVNIEKTPPSKNGKPSIKNRWLYGFLPAIPFEVVKAK